MMNGAVQSKIPNYIFKMKTVLKTGHQNRNRITTYSIVYSLQTDRIQNSFTVAMGNRWIRTGIRG